VRTLKKEIWPYQVYVTMPEVESVNELVALDNWCAQSIGRRFVDWYSYGFGDNKRTRIYAFKDEGTLLVFKLTWGHYGTW
jgi:hypothetical protein